MNILKIIKRIILNLTLFAALFSSNILFSEIQTVTIKWTAAECFASCGKGLEQQFKKIHEVAEIHMNLLQGQAELRWKPNAPFSFTPVKIAMQMIGLYINDIHIKVRGTIKHDNQNNFTLVSLGDNTTFNLLSAPSSSMVNYVEQYNPQNRVIRPDLKNQLLESERNHSVATISGPLFEPYRAPPLVLIIEHLNIAKKEQEAQ